MKKLVRDYIYLFAVAGIVILLDQVTKYLVRTNLAFGQVFAPSVWLSDYVFVVHWRNTGAAFSIFENMTALFSILGILVAGVIIYFFPRIPRQDWALRLALGLQLGGVIGNLIDRLLWGYVTDFISINNFAILNIADASIWLGVIFLIYGIWARERRLKATALEEAQDESEYDSQEIPSASLPEDQGDE